jgi:hypothetical protein
VAQSYRGRPRENTGLPSGSEISNAVIENQTAYRAG